MADFEITSPDGNRFVITAPEGATQDQVLSYAQSQFKQPTAPAAPPAPKGIPTFQTGAGGAAFGNPTLKAGVQRNGMTDVPYEIGGNVTEALAKAGLSPELAAGGGFLTNVGMSAIPDLLGAGGGARAAVKVGAPLMESGAKSLMQSAVKPVLGDLKSGAGERAVNTMLQEGVNPTTGGVAKLNGLLDGLENQLTGVLQKYTGKTVDKGAVASRMQDVVSKIERTNPTPQDALRDVNKVYDDFLTNGLIPKNIPIEQANELKRGLYQMLKQKYGIPIADETINARKALARGFKEEIQGVAPEVGPINARMGDLANARNVAERRALMDGNKNPAGLALLAHDPMAGLGFLADRWGGLKALTARGLYSGQNQIPAAGGAITGGTLAELYKQMNGR